MDTAFDQLLESPDNLEYLAEQSRLLNVSPRRFLREMGALSHKGIGSSSQAQQVPKTFQDLVAEAKACLQKKQGQSSEESAYEAALRLGIIGCVTDGPSDLSTNPKHLEGFGE
ncbi:hypothetical protein [Botrimarina mediterranea]|uniref:hypothetical protein n=1 Tax=Botrimarina mediterranea TaxID=2528022 RepID=UPI00118B54E0|nr:hypothetical protein K2D_44290 [Planctomycetes bacterium K2D]